MNKILIIDDDHDFLEGVRSVLEEAGYGFVATADSHNAHQKIRFFRPNLIILDVFLNQDNGKNIALELKDATDTQKIPILLVSGNTDIKNISQAAKVDAYLQKPFSSHQLVSSISQLI